MVQPHQARWFCRAHLCKFQGLVSWVQIPPLPLPERTRTEVCCACALAQLRSLSPLHTKCRFGSIQLMDKCQSLLWVQWSQILRQILIRFTMEALVLWVWFVCSLYMQMFENPARPLTREGFVFKRPGDSPGGHVRQQTYIQLNYNHTALPLLSKVVAPTGPKVNTHSAPNSNPTPSPHSLPTPKAHSPPHSLAPPYPHPPPPPDPAPTLTPIPQLKFKPWNLKG
jgi:hypothetical protein